MKFFWLDIRHVHPNGGKMWLGFECAGLALSLEEHICQACSESSSESMILAFVTGGCVLYLMPKLLSELIQRISPSRHILKQSA